MAESVGVDEHGPCGDLAGQLLGVPEDVARDGLPRGIPSDAEELDPLRHSRRRLRRSVSQAKWRRLGCIFRPLRCRRELEPYNRPDPVGGRPHVTNLDPPRVLGRVDTFRRDGARTPRTKGPVRPTRRNRHEGGTMSHVWSVVFGLARRHAGRAPLPQKSRPLVSRLEDRLGRGSTDGGPPPLPPR